MMSKQRVTKSARKPAATASRKANARRPASKPAKPLQAPRNGVVVRMYRQGLGDCFLLAFGGKTEAVRDTRYVLIDCGVHKRQDDGPDRLRDVMQNILESTGGRLDVVVATHEHADHLSGFVQKGSPFLSKQFTIRELWLAWTEKVGDKLADALRKRRGTARKVIQKAVDKVIKSNASARASGFQAQELGFKALRHSLDVLTDFEQSPEGSHPADLEAAHDLIAEAHDAGQGHGRSLGRFLAGNGSAAPAGFGLSAAGRATEKPTSNELALGVLQAQAKHVEYCLPGAALQVPDIDGVRVHVLGPPHDEDELKKDLPTTVRGAGDGDDKYKEVYLSGKGAGLAFQLSPSLGAVLDPLKYPDDLRHPFESSKRRAIDLARMADLASAPQATRVLFEGTYFQPGSDWRRIDGDWLNGAEELALNLDSDTNNTSLVLAFEWKKGVLLFPGDAQVGNWLSWRDQNYEDQNGKTTLSVEDLFQRTILYKVGHHASHNATLKRDPQTATDENPLGGRYGLELMENIIALIPVDRAAAEKNMPTPWEMPHAPLYERLREKAHRRVLRADARTNIRPLKKSEPGDVVPVSQKDVQVPDMKGAHWRRSAETLSDADDPLYYEITLT